MPFFLDWLQQQRSTTATDTSSVQQHDDSSASNRVAGLTSLVSPQLSHILKLQQGAASTGPQLHCKHAQQQTPISPVSSSSTHHRRPSPCTAANKLHLKTVVDLNSGARAAELSWHVRLQQQPGRLAVKLSNTHKTRVTYEAHVALRNTGAGPMLKLAGSPQGIHSAALLIRPRPAGSSSSSSSAAMPVDAPAPAPDAGSGQAAAPQGTRPNKQQPISSNSPASCSNDTTSAPTQPIGAAHASSTITTPSSPPAKPRRARHRQRQRQDPGDNQAQQHSHTPSQVSKAAPPELLQQQQDAATQLSHSGLLRPGSSMAVPLQAVGSSVALPAGCCQPAGPSRSQQAVAAALQAELPPAAAVVGSSTGGAPSGLAQLHWEVGWSWKAGGPVASVSKQFDPNSSGCGSGGGAPNPWALQQFKAAYDAKGCSYTLTGGGAGWSVTVAVPTHAKGFGGLVPRLWKDGCRPKVTVSLVPGLTWV